MDLLHYQLRQSYSRTEISESKSIVMIFYMMLVFVLWLKQSFPSSKFLL